MITPLNDVVIIRKDKTETTAGGIELLDSYKDPAGTDTGIVQVIKRGYRNEHEAWMDMSAVQEGQRVLFLRKHGIVIKGHKDLVAVRYNNILAVVE